MTFQKVSLSKLNRFKYNFQGDNSVFRQLVIDNVKISACTVAGDPQKLNEDAFAVSWEKGKLYLAVFDGVTSLIRLKNLIGQTGARYASHTLRDYFLYMDKNGPLKAIFEKMNSKMLAENLALGGTLKKEVSLASTLALMARIDFQNNLIEFANLGDTFLLIYFKDNSIKYITVKNGKKFDKNIFSLIRKIAQKRNISNREAREVTDVQDLMLKQSQGVVNKADGTGVGRINGDPKCFTYLQERKVELSKVAAVLIATDGLAIQGNTLDDIEYRKSLREIIKAGGMERLISEKRKSEDDDPNFNYLRYKHSDDATGIMVEFG